MGNNISKSHSSFKILLLFFKPLHFFSMVLPFFTKSFPLSLTWDLMGGKVSKRYPSTSHLWNFPSFSWSFFSMLLAKVLFFFFFGFLTFLFFEFSRFLSFSLHGAQWEQNCKTLVLQIAFELLQTPPEFSYQRSPQKYCLRFLKFWISDL